MRELGVYRLSVHRTPQHIYAQIISPAGDRVLASASTLDKDLRSGSTGNVEAATAVGKLDCRARLAAGREPGCLRPRGLPVSRAREGSGRWCARRRIGILG
jgi:ribosomal protein L18